MNSRSNVIAGGAIRAPHYADLIPDAVVNPSLSVALIAWDDDYRPLDSIEVWDAGALTTAVVGAYGTLVSPLLDSKAARKTLVVAADLRALPDGSTEIDGHGRRLSWAAIQSVLLSVQELGVGVTQCRPADVVAHLRMLLTRERGPVIVRRERHPYSDRITWLASIAGIGERTAKAVIEHCGGDMAAALMALTDPAIPPPSSITPTHWQKVQRLCRQWLGVPDGVRMTLDVIATKQEEHYDNTHLVFISGETTRDDSVT